MTRAGREQRPRSRVDPAADVRNRRTARPAPVAREEEIKHVEKEGMREPVAAKQRDFRARLVTLACVYDILPVEELHHVDEDEHECER